MKDLPLNHTQQNIFTCRGCDLHYRLTGPLHAPLVVLTHGVTMDHHMFAAQVDALQHQYRVLTWDVRGHNESQPVGKDFSVAAVTEDLIALLDHLDYPQAILVGHSMGGLVSQEFLFRHPERVSGLVTIGSPCITLTPPKFFAWLMKQSPVAINLLPYSFFKRLAALDITVTPPVRAYVYHVLDRISKQQFVTMWSAVVNCIHPEPGYVITHPQLITYGQHDNLGFGFLKLQAHAWAKRDPNSRCVAIPKSAHNAHQENPDFFNRLLLDFLQNLTQSKKAITDGTNRSTSE